MFGQGKAASKSFGGAVRFAWLCLLLALCFTAGCSISSDNANEPTPSPDIDVDIEFTPDPLTTNGRRTPLTLAVHEYEWSGRAVRCPLVCDDGMGLLNIAIRKTFNDAASGLSADAVEGSVDYDVEYNNRGLLSLTLFVTGSDGQREAFSTASYDCDTGLEIKLSDCFGTCDGSYRFALSDKATEKLTAQGHVPISYLPPVDDARLFCFNDRGLTLLYRRYEVCGAEAGTPRVLLRYSEIAGYLGEDALLRRLPYFD